MYKITTVRPGKGGFLTSTRTYETKRQCVESFPSPSNMQAIFKVGKNYFVWPIDKK